VVLFVGGSHVRASLERARIVRADSQQAWTKPDGRESTGVDLFLYLFAANEPILRQFGDGDVRLQMRLKILDCHFDPLGELVTMSEYVTDLCKISAELRRDAVEGSQCRSAQEMSRIKGIFDVCVPVEISRDIAGL